MKKEFTFKEFEKQFNSAKSKNKIVVDKFYNIRYQDYKDAAKFIDEHIKEISKNSIIILLFFASTDTDAHKEAFDEYMDNWFVVFLEKNPSKRDLNTLFKKNKPLKIKTRDFSPEIKLMVKKYTEDNLTEEIKEDEEKLVNFNDLMNDNEYVKAFESFNDIKESDLKQSKVAAWLASYFLEIQQYVLAKELITYALNAKPKNHKFLQINSEIDQIRSPYIKAKEVNIVANIKKQPEEKEAIKNNDEKIPEFKEEKVLTVEEIVQKYKLDMFSSNEKMLRAIVKNKEDESYLSFYDENDNDPDLLYELFTSKYELDDDTKLGFIKALNRLTYHYINLKNFTRAEVLNNIALRKRPENNDAKRFEEKIINKEVIVEESQKDIYLEDSSSNPPDFGEQEDFKFEDYKDINQELELRIRKRNESKYISIVNEFINNDQFKHTHGIEKDLDNNQVIAKIKTDISNSLWYLDLDIRAILRKYMFKVEDKMSMLGSMKGFYWKSNSTKDLYSFLLYQNLEDLLNDIIFNVNKIRMGHSFIKHNILAREREKDLFRILLNIFRGGRNFLVHSTDGLFNKEFSVFSGINSNYSEQMAKSLDDLEELDIIVKIAVEDAREKHNMFHLIIFMLLITNDSKVAYNVLSEIDYMLYRFVSSLSVGAKNKFYNALGLKYNWFDNIVKFLSNSESN